MSSFTNHCRREFEKKNLDTKSKRYHNDPIKTSRQEFESEKYIDRETFDFIHR